MEWEQKLAQWQAEGLVDPETVERINAFEKRQPKKRKVPLLLVVGMIFFALAVFSFIAANWQVIPAVAKVGMVVLLMWLFYVLAHFSETKHFGQPLAFRLLGLSMFFASLVVTGQTFHLGLSSNLVPWALFIAALAHFFIWRHIAYNVIAFLTGLSIISGAAPGIGWVEWGFLLAAGLAWFYFSKDGPAMVFSWLVLLGTGFLTWSLLNIESPLVPVWTLFALVPLLLLVPKQRKAMLAPLYLITGAIQLLVYLAARGASEKLFADLNLAESVALLAAGLVALWLAYSRFRSLLWLGVLGLIGILLYDNTAIILAIVTELAALGYLIAAQRNDRPLAVGFLYFVVVQFVIYVIYAWERLDMSLFFLIGALLLFALSGAAWWMNRRKEGAVS